jgi:hypothetical protein
MTNVNSEDFALFIYQRGYYRDRFHEDDEDEGDRFMDESQTAAAVDAESVNNIANEMMGTSSLVDAISSLKIMTAIQNVGLIPSSQNYKNVTLSTAQRLAAAVLLFQGDCYFKRLISSTPPALDRQGEDGAVYITEGGYRACTVDELYRKQAQIFVPMLSAQRVNSESLSTSLSLYAQAEQFYLDRVVSSCRRALELYSVSANEDMTSGQGQGQFRNRYTRHRDQYHQRNVRVPKVVKYVFQGLNAVYNRTLEVSPQNTKLLLAHNFDIPQLLSKQQPTNKQTTPQPAESVDSNALQGASVDKSPDSTNNDSLLSVQRAVTTRRASIAGIVPCASGQKNTAALGKVDFRSSAQEHPVICMDNVGTKFYDDAFSVSTNGKYFDYDIMTCRLLKNAIFSETLGEIMIHIVDIAPYILDKQHQTISAAARERAFSMFGLDSQSAVHMLPITTLNALKLSTHEPNDVITIAFKLNPSSGQIMSYRVFESIIGPVQTVTLDEADRALHHLQQIKNLESSGDSRSIHGSAVHLLPGYSKNLLRDLKYVHQFVQQNSDVSKWVGYQTATATADEQPHPHQSGDTLSSEDEMTSSASKSMLNKLLSLYSHHAYQFCVANGIHVPIVWSNRMSTGNSIIRRFATKPLRNWISLVRQLYICCISWSHEFVLALR